MYQSCNILDRSTDRSVRSTLPHVINKLCLVRRRGAFVIFKLSDDETTFRINEQVGVTLGKPVDDPNHLNAVALLWLKPRPYSV
jgi:hypothetical protein